MKPHEQYLKFVQWSDEDELFIGYCPDLFPHGGVCHNEVEIGAYAQLCEIVEDVVNDYITGGEPLPEVSIDLVSKFEDVRRSPLAESGDLNEVTVAKTSSSPRTSAASV